MAQVLRLGIAGLRRGSDFVPALQAREDTVMAAVCDPDPARVEELKERLGEARVCESYEEILDSGIDAVIVATPIHLHVPQSVEALRRGIHVLSEVSAAVSLEQCEALVAAVRGSSAKYMMAENCCYMQPFMVIEEMVRAGLFGEVYYAEADYVSESRGWRAPGGWQDEWLFGRRGGTYITHPLGTALNWMDDRAVTVSCLGTGAHVEPSRGVDDTSIMLCTTSKGGLVKIRQDTMSPRPSTNNYAALQGTKGAYEAPRHAGDTHRVYLASPGADRRHKEWRPLSDFEQEYLPGYWEGTPGERGEVYGGSDYHALRAFVDCILNDTEPPIDVYRALDFTMPGLLSEVSVKQGGAPVEVPDFRLL